MSQVLFYELDIICDRRMESCVLYLFKRVLPY